MIRHISFAIALLTVYSFAQAEEKTLADKPMADKPVHDTAEAKKTTMPSDKQAMGWLMAGAQKGDAFAQYSLGYKYYSGEGVAQDYQQAFNWFAKSAEQGMTEAQFKLATLFAEGKGVKKDELQAVAWLTKAAGKRHPAAQYSLGEMYQKGQGVQQSDKAAYAWFAIAATNGNVQAEASRDALAATLSPDALKEAKREMADLSKKIK